MRTTLVLVLLLAVCLAAPAQAKGPGTHVPPGAGAHASDASDFANLSTSARDHGLARAEAGHAFARFAYANGSASGRYVSFKLDESTGALSSFAVNGTNGSIPVFTSVVPDAFVGNGSANVAGAVLHLDDDNASLSAHNNPTANFDYSTGADSWLNVTLTLDSSVQVVNFSGGGLRLNLGASGAHGHVFATGNGSLTLSADNKTIVASVPPNGALFFLKHPGEGALQSDVHNVVSALASGHVGAIDTIVDADGSPLEDRTFAGVETRAHDASHGHANVTIRSDDATGKAVLLNFDASVLAPADVSKIVVTLDGANLPRLDNASQALAATNASVWFNATADGVQVIVSVPHFSDHELSVQTVDSTTSATPTASATTSATATPSATPPATAATKAAPGVELLGLVTVGVVAALLVRARRS